MTHFELGRTRMISAALGALVLACALATGVGWAQDTTAEAATAGADARDTAPAYPAGLDDPTIELDKLELRMIPLTADELAALAAVWQAQARAAAQAVVDQSLEVRAADGEEAEALRKERLELVEERGRIFEKASAVIASLEAKGGDPAEVESMQGYLDAVIDAGRSQLTLQEFTDGFLKWLVSPEGGVAVGFRLAVIIGSFFVLLIVARIVRAWVRRAVDRTPQLSNLLSGFLVMLVYWLTIAFGLMFVLALLGVNITPLFALVGGASFILAFAMQETLGNLAAGLMIMINRPFDEGDYVQVAGLGGTIKHVSIMSTTVTTPDNQVITIPNSRVWGDVITNVTASDTRRVDLVFGIGYGDSIEQAQQVLEDVVTNHPLVLEDPAPNIRVSELGDSSVNFIVRPWTKTADYWTVYWDLQRAVKEAFDANGISIPFPQTDMHLHVADNEKAASPAVVSTLIGDDTEKQPAASDYASGDYGADEPGEAEEGGDGGDGGGRG
ncbi:small conductance mechanosensitive channel [Thiohalocapsa halophila]|uniref:Small-conductance mechanosensitive channel n=2 Tax=Thiohalocapsa halophila TaxID=69359 RepID=A0ABS1CK31_9GAMM|nr:small conductance mechanosensitive channel [Thiohalocapsa halophila]